MSKTWVHKSIGHSFVFSTDEPQIREGIRVVQTWLIEQQHLEMARLHKAILQEAIDGRENG